MNGNYKIIKAPDASRNIFYKLLKRVVIAMNMRQSLTGTKEEVLTKAARMNRKRSYSIIPSDGKANYTDHLIGGQYHCVETDIGTTRQQKAILFVFGGGMILGSDKGDIALCRRIAQITEHDVWFPYYPMCHEHDMLENVEMIFGCYEKMLQFYRPENIVFLGFSSGAALLLDVITYINEQRDKGRHIPMPGLLIPVSAPSVPVNDKERERIRKLDKKDILIPASYFELARDIMLCGHDVPEKYLATAHGDFRNAPITHFYYGSHETVYAFAPSYAKSYQKADAECIIHVGKGMHHIYALQYMIPGCKPAFDEIMGIIREHSAVKQ